MIKAFIQAARLRTLPLSISGIIIGASLGNRQYECFLKSGFNNCNESSPVFMSLIFWLAIMTTVGLQVLSNFANDYGDGVKGTDNNREGEKRLVASGVISENMMKRAIIISAAITFFIALFLIYTVFKEDYLYALVFVVLGLASIIAAIKYTVGKKAYGYSGFGDLFVFLFFGLLSTVGSFFLYTKTIYYDVFLPASSVGLLSASVLNLNNMRDRVEDFKHNKITLVVRLGDSKSKIYHYILICLALVLALLYVYLNYKSPKQFLFLIAFIPLVDNIIFVAKNHINKKLDPELKKVALSTFLFAVLFSIFN